MTAPRPPHARAVALYSTALTLATGAAALGAEDMPGPVQLLALYDGDPAVDPVHMVVDMLAALEERVQHVRNSTVALLTRQGTAAEQLDRLYGPAYAARCPRRPQVPAHVSAMQAVLGSLSGATHLLHLALGGAWRARRRPALGAPPAPLPPALAALDCALVAAGFIAQAAQDQQDAPEDTHVLRGSARAALRLALRNLDEAEVEATDRAAQGG